MTQKSQIEKPVEQFFDLFQQEFSQALRSDVETIKTAIEKIHSSNGKHIRPLLLLLTAEACGQATSLSVESAVLMELLHTASLIHDDVIDETKQRRGVPSLNAIYDNRIAVLVGDFILANTLIRSLETGETQIVTIIATLCRDMAEGEVKQLENSKNVTLSEKDYFRMLEKKTAALLAACAQIGAITAGADHELQMKCRKFGHLLGCSFQIKDDIFDYFDNHNIGKPNGNDIREGKITLPLLYAFETTPVCEKAGYLEILNQRAFTPGNIASLIEFAKERGGIEYAESRMMEFKRQAIDLIETLPLSEAKKSLLLLADYLVDRVK
ncbi:MAG: polyprenyl synthetase family protein [Tannerella sp.]|jgi:octaprenyl-diphosphate synthase|nr:polyprenyl synthetase family protein [Tannerella sp.]